MSIDDALFRKLRSGRLPATALVLEIAAFGLVAGAIWLNEIFDLPHRWLGAPEGTFRPHEALTESGLVLLLGMAVAFFTIRTARHRESLIRICAWCHRVKLDDKWVTVERFLASHRAKTTHGMCEQCSARMEDELV